ncbi:hypothetical protein LCGC14_1669330 [marine sediment metagenome]|uniref:HNH nuclease domain-containing protein n=1 Tax=marine sediment metagenome TaxID=412755 RepID=A0A0F9KRU2_9ZZZZ
MEHTLQLETQARFFDKVDRSGTGCQEWQAGKTKGGYGTFQLDGKTQYAHRVMWSCSFGDIPDGLQVLHRCDNPSCVNPAHLFLGTHADNMKDMRDKGRHSKGLPHRLVSGHKTAAKQSRFKGVSWAIANSKWQAYIRINGKTRYLGYFLEEEDAHAAYQNALAQQ